MRRRILFDTGFFHVYFSGLNEEAKRAVKEVYSGKSVGYTLDLNLAEFLIQRGKGVMGTKKPRPLGRGLIAPL